MQTTTVKEAAKNFEALLQQVREGQEVLIEENGELVAKLSPLSNHCKTFGENKQVTEKLRQSIQEGINSGPSIDAELVFSRLRGKYIKMTEE